MGGNATERLSWKEPLHSLQVELERDYGLTPVGSRALLLRIGEFIDSVTDSGCEARAGGQISYPAVAIGERAGKPLRYCVTVAVSLTMVHPEDAEILHHSGTPALRRVRLSRLCSEAYRQGAVLSHEDLALMLCVDLSTVRRLCKECEQEGERPPTRGMVEDIGPTISHKEQVIRSFFRGHLPARIAARTGHSLGSVERYLGDFARVLELHRKGLERQATVRITGLSPSLVRTYLSLVARFDQPAHQSVVERLRRRFVPVDEDQGGR